MKIGNLEINGQVVLAPMAGVTDLAYRTICAEMGAAITVTEMVSSRALCYQDKKSVSLLGKTPTGICGAQIFGNDPEIMAKSAKLALEHSGCDFIDINMCCPMPKIANSGDGCGLMREPQLAADIVSAVKDAVTVPVTIKCRKGWDKGSVNVVEFAQLMEERGADAVCVHGRTRTQLYSGNADWDIIRDVKNVLRVPVIANGDVHSGEKAVQCLKRTGADMVMVGRAAFGDPWVIREVDAMLRGEELPARPPLAERVDVALRQFELAAADKCERVACLEARKHFAWYLRGVPYANYYKEKISMVSTLEEIREIAKGIKRDLK